MESLSTAVFFDHLLLSELHDQIIVVTVLLYEARVLTKDGATRDSGLVETVW